MTAGHRDQFAARRRRFLEQLARETGTTVADVERHLSEAIAAGLLTETPDGWQATFPPEPRP